MQIFPEPVALRSPRFIAVAVLILALAVVPPFAEAIGSPFHVTLALRILIFALAAASLNLVLGYGGLMSFGHALYLGLGAYVVAILSFHGLTSGWLHLGVTLVLSALAQVPSQRMMNCGRND
jgi:branched-chain amino acid transport system permease protein